MSLKYMDHTAYPKKVRKMSDEQLFFIIKDAREAIRAMPDGPNVGYYQDEVNYCVNELFIRRKREQKRNRRMGKKSHQSV
jgi:hypothetical protein